MDILVIDADDPVPRLHAGLRRRVALHHVRHHGSVVADASDDEKRQEKGQNEIKDRAGRHHGNSRPDGFRPEGVGRKLSRSVRLSGAFYSRARLRQRFPVHGIRFRLVIAVLALHHTGTAEGQEPEGVPGLPDLSAQEHRAHSQGKFIDPDAAPFGQQEMSQLMENDNQAEYQDREDPTHDAQSTTCFR